jgi:hypothetical protein
MSDAAADALVDMLDDVTNERELEALLILLFAETKINSTDAKAKFYGRRQQHDETLASYVAALTRLANDAFESVDDSRLQVRDQFIAGIHDEAYRRAIISSLVNVYPSGQYTTKDAVEVASVIACRFSITNNYKTFYTRDSEEVTKSSLRKAAAVSNVRPDTTELFEPNAYYR